MLMRNPQPEILDHLPPDHSDAVASRRDLRLINTLMGNDRWLHARLTRHLKPGMKIVELGAGDGSFARRVFRQIPRDFPMRFTGVDLAPCPEDWPEDPRFQWRQEDLFHSDALTAADGLVACLLLHHFDNSALAALGARLGNARFLLAREPARRRLWMRLLLYPFRLNRVTKHDMKISIEAGFLGSELADALGLRAPEWDTSHRETPLNAHQLEATRFVNDGR